MKISSRAGADQTVHLSVSGEADMETVDAFAAALHEAVTGTAAEVVVDLSGLTFCDSSGVAALDRAYGEAADHGTVFRLAGVQPMVRRVLELTGVYERMTRS